MRLILVLLACLLNNAVCTNVDEICWDCLADRSSYILASHPALKNLTNCNPQNISAEMAFLSTRSFNQSFFGQYTNCQVFCGDKLNALLLGEFFDVSSRAIMKCALRSLSAPAVAYWLRACSLRCMLVALRVRRPHTQTPASSAMHRDAFVYLGPPHKVDLRGKRGAGNWAEFKLSLQVALLLHRLVCFVVTSALQHLRSYWPSAAHSSLVILHEGYSLAARLELQNAGNAVAAPASASSRHAPAAGRPVVFHQVNLTAAFSSYKRTNSSASAEGMSSFGLGYRGMCRSAAAAAS